MTDPAEHLDLRGLLCPLPALKARKKLAQLPAGTAVELWADDPAAQRDIPDLCQVAGHRLDAQQALDDAGLAWFRISAHAGEESAAS